MPRSRLPCESKSGHFAGNSRSTQAFDAAILTETRVAGSQHGPAAATAKTARDAALPWSPPPPPQCAFPASARCFAVLIHSKTPPLDAARPRIPCVQPLPAKRRIKIAGPFQPLDIVEEIPHAVCVRRGNQCLAGRRHRSRGARSLRLCLVDSRPCGFRVARGYQNAGSVLVHAARPAVDPAPAKQFLHEFAKRHVMIGMLFPSNQPD